MALLEKIRKISLEAATKLEKVDCCADSEMRTLTQNELQELLPGLSNFRIRKKIYETIHKKRPINVVLNDLKSFVPDEFLKDALSSDGAFNEYLEMLKTLKVEISHVQQFLDAQIDLLEKYRPTQDTKSKTAPPFASSFGPSNFETNRNPQVQATVTYLMAVIGETFQRHLDVMEKLKNDGRGFLNLQETKYSHNEDVIIVFCSIFSLDGTDVDLVLQPLLDYVSGEKPIILVMTHHNRPAKTSPVVKPSYHNVVLVVNVFFHETLPGLLKCPQNDEAIVSIQNKLQTLSR